MTIIMTLLKVNIHEAMAILSQYVAAGGRGETVVICHRNIPVAELRALPRPGKRPLPIGLYRGKFKVPRSFFDPLPAEIEAAFRGE